MSAQLIAKLIEAGTPAALVAEVAMELGRAQAAAEILEQRRKHERDRKAKSRDVTGQNVTARDGAEIQDGVSLNKEKSPRPPKEINPIPCERKARAWVLPAGVSLAVWTDFLTNRRRKRLVNTESTWKSFQDDLARVSAQTGIPPPKLIEQCTGKGWGGIYDPRKDDHGQQRTNGVGRNQPNDGLSSTARAALDVFGADARH